MAIDEEEEYRDDLVIGEFEKIFGPEDDFITMPTLSQTQHICIIPSGGYNALLVTDPETKSLILLKRDGSFQRSYRYTSCLNDLLGISLEFPTGVAPSKSQNELYVTDCTRHRLFIFGYKTALMIASWGELGSGPGQLRCPMQISVTEQGNILIADSGNHRVLEFQVNGTLLHQFGTGVEGREPGQLSNPKGVGVLSTGEVVVADTFNHRVQVFSANTQQLLRYWGKRGNLPSQFMFPQAIAVTRADEIIVADHGNHRLQIFKDDGTFRMLIGNEGDGPGQFRAITGVATTDAGEIYASDELLSRVQIFR